MAESVTESGAPGWLEIVRGESPLLLSLPHTGTEMPPDIAEKLVSLPLARKDADWWIEKLYDFAAGLGATVIRTRLSRTVIDVNRDPSGASLYPGQTTTGLCPVESFDGEPLYRKGMTPDDAEIARRRQNFFTPYHQAIETEIERLRGHHARIVLYDAHSIRSRVPRLFDSLLPHVNIGTNDGASCDSKLTAMIEQKVNGTPFTHVTNGRFKGGWITRHYGRPERGVHAIQIELAMRGYMREPEGSILPDRWPPAYDPAIAAPMRNMLQDILTDLREADA